VALDERGLHREEAEQVDHAVPRRHKERDVVESIAVDPPDERAEHLEAGRDRDACPHLRARAGRRLEGGEVEGDEGEDAQDVLLPQGGDLAVGEKP